MSEEENMKSLNPRKLPGRTEPTANFLKMVSVGKRGGLDFLCLPKVEAWQKKKKKVSGKVKQKF